MLLLIAIVFRRPNVMFVYTIWWNKRWSKSWWRAPNGSPAWIFIQVSNFLPKYGNSRIYYWIDGVACDLINWYLWRGFDLIQVGTTYWWGRTTKKYCGLTWTYLQSPTKHWNTTGMLYEPSLSIDGILYLLAVRTTAVSLCLMGWSTSEFSPFLIAFRFLTLQVPLYNPKGRNRSYSKSENY